MKGYKYQIPAMYAIPDIGGLLGSFINKAINGGASSTNNQTVVKGSFADMPMNAIINWKSDGLYFLQCFEENFEEEFEENFKMFCSTFKVDQEILNRSERMRGDIDQRVANATQQNIAQQQRSFQAWQQANATRQAACDAYK